MKRCVFSVRISTIAFGYELRDAEAAEYLARPTFPAARKLFDLSDDPPKLASIDRIRASTIVFPLESLGHISCVGAFPDGAGEFVMGTYITPGVPRSYAAIHWHVDMVSGLIINAYAIVADFGWPVE
jgi:hypothetical protein